METIYVKQDKCSVRREGEHLRLVRSGDTLATVPLVGARSIVLFDSVSVTAPALDLLLCKGIDIIYQSKFGKTKGRFISAKSGGVITRFAQYSAFSNPERRLAIAKAIVDAKIQSQLEVVKKYKLHDTNSAFDNQIKSIRSFQSQLATSDSIEKIMGVEGISAKHYWECFGRLLKNHVFTRREYRPSPDYVNALLNLGYSFLCNEITTSLLAKQLDLELGFLHSIHYGRNSLALDIMEEFRACFIDEWVLALLNKKQLALEHFKIENGDWRMTDIGFRKFCTLYHDHVMLWRNKFRAQAAKLKNALIKEIAYEPYRK